MKQVRITPKAKDLGDGFVVRRALPDMKVRSVGPFVFGDHMGPVEINEQVPMKVRAHPHIGLATITWLFSGEIMHRDSLGNEQPIRPGEVNWMTAGSGIVHSERASIKEGEEAFELEGIQLWLALPIESEEVDASFYHCKQKDLPQIELERASASLIAGKAFGKESPVPVYSELFYLNIDLNSGGNFKYSLKENEEAALYVINGEVAIKGETCKRYEMIVFEKGSDISFTSSTDSKVMFFGGETFSEKRHLWWNFVSSSKDKIEEAKKKWQEDAFGQVINETERIPLPES